MVHTCRLCGVLKDIVAKNVVQQCIKELLEGELVGVKQTALMPNVAPDQKSHFLFLKPKAKAMVEVFEGMLEKCV